MPGRLYQSTELAREVTPIYCPYSRERPGWAVMGGLGQAQRPVENGPSTVGASPGKGPLWPINRLGGQETGNPENTMKPGAQGFPPG